MHKKVKTQLIIQARMNSMRLPGKILTEISKNISVLEWIIRRAKTSNKVDRVLVATTLNAKDDETEKLCQSLKCPVVRGSEEDVSDRFRLAVEQYPCDVIVHVTADNLFFDIDEMNRMIDYIYQYKLDYVSNHPTNMSVGTGTEVFTTVSFKKIPPFDLTSYDREHVTPYYYNHPELFNQKVLKPINHHVFSKSARLTLDTREDLTLIMAILKGLNFSEPEDQPSLKIILDFLESHHDIAKINSHVVQKTFPSKNNVREV